MEVTKETITRSARVHIYGDVYIACDIVAGVYNDEIVVVSSRVRCDSDTKMKVITNN